ncbi:unnamed protein product, partial [Prorocentrum cordatum]
ATARRARIRLPARAWADLPRARGPVLMLWRLRRRPSLRRPRWPPWLVLGRCLLLASEARIVAALFLLFGRHLHRRGEFLQWVALAKVALQDAISGAPRKSTAPCRGCFGGTSLGSLPSSSPPSC